MSSYEQTTNGISVSVDPYYLDDESSPDDQRFVWAYRVQIENNGKNTVQLINRHWQITDKIGRIQEVRGEGVVGEQPILHPGDCFEYTSGAPLATPSGLMVGTYEMKYDSGESFTVDIPAFSLDSPYDLSVLN